MCGIFGYIGTNKLLINENILPHRGPDDWGVVNCFYGNKNITLFQSRLSIIGLGKQGHQPFQKYEGKLLIFNGEIYNFLDIKKRLAEDFKINFITSTDTEVLYEAIINWGLDKTLRLINGMFAFSFYNKYTSEVFIVRDNLGIKPLYYSVIEDNFIFSSEIKAFFELGLRKAELDKDYLGEYFANGWIYEPNTLFKNIFKLNAGHYIVFNILTGTSQNIKYWDITDLSSSSEIPDIKKIIINQTIADVPIGNYFSGGIDSSIITYILKDKDLLNINLSMDDAESVRLSIMEKDYRLNLKKIHYQRANLDEYERLIYFIDEPIADPAIIPAFQLATESRFLGRCVMMSGMGGDEIDSGYSRHFILSNNLLLTIVGVVPKFLIQLLFRGKRLRDLLRLKEFTQNISPENYYTLTSYYKESEISNLIGSDGWIDFYRAKINNLCLTATGKKKYYYLDFKGFLASHNLIYIDKASMAASVEVRVPFLDKNLAIWFFRDIDKRKNGKKRRLKSYLKSLIGERYVNSKKSGFRYDINEWLTSDIDWAEVILFYQKNRLLNTDQISSYLIEMKHDIESVAMKLWMIYTLYLWIKTFDIILPKETIVPRN